MPEESPERLPFEPRKKRPKPESSSASGGGVTGKPAQSSTPQKSSPSKSPTKAIKDKPAKDKPKSKPEKTPRDRQALAVPEVVSDRMIRRMAILSGLPIVLGVLTFVGSYFVVVNDLFNLPNTAVLLVSMGWFGLGVLGLSYGVISASWDEESPGSLLGWSEFTLNFERLMAAWREARQKSLK